MKTKSAARRKPSIIVSDEDHERLVALASRSVQRNNAVAVELLEELDRARLVRSARFPAQVVRMGSVVQFRSADGTTRRVTLVYPPEADISLGKVSILTPIGVALIGLSQDQSFTWTNQDGISHELTVLSVEAEVPA